MTAVWPFKPRQDIVETLEWLTDVHRCKRAEYRRCKRPQPRTEYQYKYLLDEVDYGAARELARIVGGDPVLVPDWINATHVPTISPGTVSLPVDITYAPAYKGVGSSVLIFSSLSSYEVVTLTGWGSGTISITATAQGHTNPEVIPLRVGTLPQEFAGDRGPHRYVAASTRFLCVDTEDLNGSYVGIGYPTYLGNSVVTDPIEIINSVQDHIVREVDTIDSKTGPIYNYPLYSAPTQAAVLAWTLQSALELWNLRVWLHTRRGRCKQFWTSSWNNDVLVSYDVNTGDTALQIVAMGFAAKYALPVDMAITALDGSMQFVRITAASADAAGHSYLTLSTPFVGTSIAATNILKTSKLTLARLAADRIDIQHLPGRQATVVAATTEVLVYP